MIQLKEIAQSLNLTGQPSIASNQAPAPTADPRQQQQQLRQLSKEEKKRLKEMVSQFNHYSKTVYREGRLSDVANDLREICRLTESYLVTESGDFVESNTAKRHIQEIKKYCDNFAKLAEELDVKNRQAEALYKDIGTRLENYFEIKDAGAPTVNQTKGSAALEDPRTTSVVTDDIDEAQEPASRTVAGRMSPSIRDPRIINPALIKL
jgi:hypothetical protein